MRNVVSLGAPLFQLCPDVIDQILQTPQPKDQNWRRRRSLSPRLHLKSWEQAAFDGSWKAADFEEVK